MLRLPIEFQKERCRPVDSALREDLELTKGSRPLYRCLFGTEPGIEEHLFDRYSQFHSDSKDFIYDTQSLVGKKPPRVVGPENIEFIAKMLEANASADSSFHDKYGYMAWQPLEWMNSSPSTLGAVFGYRLGAPVLSLIVPIICILVPFVLMIYHNTGISIESYLSFLQGLLKNHTFSGLFVFPQLSTEKKLVLAGTIAFYCFQTYMNVQECATNYSNLTHIRYSMNRLKVYVSETIEAIDSTAENTTGLATYTGFKTEITTLREELVKLSSSMAELNDCDPRCLGGLMAIWFAINRTESLRATLSKTVDFNVYTRNLKSLSSLARNKKLCRVRTGKCTSFNGLRYIQIASPRPVSISLKTGIALTGPNSSGKTTLLKSVLGATLIGQQFGYAPCRKCKISLYSELHSYLNIVDTCEKDSVFEREALKCKKVLESVQASTHRHLCIFDELFSGTNPSEASAAGSSYLNHLAESGRVDFLMTTHLTRLCEHLDPAKSRNINMAVKKTETGFEPTYSISEGISYTGGANKVLRKMEFPPDIVVLSERLAAQDSFVSPDNHIHLN